MDKIVYIPVTSFFCLAESHSPVLASLISIPSDPRLPESLQIGLFWAVYSCQLQIEMVGQWVGWLLDLRTAGPKHKPGTPLHQQLETPGPKCNFPTTDSNLPWPARTTHYTTSPIQQFKQETPPNRNSQQWKLRLQFPSTGNRELQVVNARLNPNFLPWTRLQLL